MIPFNTNKERERERESRGAGNFGESPEKWQWCGEIEQVC